MLDGQQPHRLQQRVGGDVLVAQRPHDLGLGLQPLLVGVEHVEGRARAEPRLLGDALGGDARRLDLLAAGDDRGARHVELGPGLATAWVTVRASSCSSKRRWSSSACAWRTRLSLRPAGVERQRALDADLAEGCRRPSRRESGRRLPRSTPTEPLSATVGPLAASARSKS